MENKKSRPVLTHQGGKGKTFIVILPLLRGVVKAACVTLGVYILAALAVLNVPSLVAAILIENALLGTFFKIGGIEHEKV